MDINAAIDQLTKFKKMPKALNKCDLIGFGNALKAKFGSGSTASSQKTYRPVLGFSQQLA